MKATVTIELDEYMALRHKNDKLLKNVSQLTNDYMEFVRNSENKVIIYNHLSKTAYIQDKDEYVQQLIDRIKDLEAQTEPVNKVKQKWWYKLFYKS